MAVVLLLRGVGLGVGGEGLGGALPGAAEVGSSSGSCCCRRGWLGRRFDGEGVGTGAVGGRLLYRPGEGVERKEEKCIGEGNPEVCG